MILNHFTPRGLAFMLVTETAGDSGYYYYYYFKFYPQTVHSSPHQGFLEMEKE